MEDDDGGHNAAYIITEDLEQVLGPWAKERGFNLPNPHFFTSLRKDFRKRLKEALSPGHGKNVKILSLSHGDLRKDIVSGIDNRVFNGPRISLDEIYFPEAEYFLSITRAVPEPEGNSWGSAKTVSRITRLPIKEDEQISEIADKVKKDLGENASVDLLDDGCFEGDTISEMVSIIECHGVRVEKIGVALKIRKRDQNPITQRVVAFSKEIDEPIDWVCERDFFPGVPLFGRSLIPLDNTIDLAASYFYIPDSPHLGNAKWASLSPEEIGEDKSAVFSEMCVRLTIDLFDEIGRVSGRPVLWQNITRKPFGIKGSDGELFTALLEDQFLSCF